MGSQNNAREIVKTLDLSAFKLDAEVPFCPVCGTECRRHGRQEIWSCDPCEFSITLSSWDIVMLHAAVLDYVLKCEGIEHIIYEGVPINRKDAVGPSHLMPLFVTTAREIGEAFGFLDSIMLETIPVSDEAAQSGTSLLAVSVQATSNGAPHESLHLLLGAADHAIKKFRKDDETGGSMDYSYIYEAGDAYEEVA